MGEMENKWLQSGVICLAASGQFFFLLYIDCVFCGVFALVGSSAASAFATLSVLPDAMML